MGGPFAVGQTLMTRTPRARRALTWEPGDGAVFEAAANTPLSLDDPGLVYFVEDGSVDVFSVPPTRPGDPPGPRRYLWTVEKGESLFGFEPLDGATGHVFVGVCVPGTRLRRVTMQVVERKANENEWVFIQLVEGFVARLAGAMVLRPQLDATIQDRVPVSVPAGKAVGPVSSDLIWVRHISGESLFGGLSDLVLGPNDPPLPLAKGMWLETLSEAKLFAIRTDLCMASGDAFGGLAKLRALFRACAARVAALEETDEQGRLARKAGNEERMRAQGIATLASVLTGDSLEVTAVGDDDDALVRACRVVGRADGIEFKPSPKWEAGSRVRDPLAALCRASRLRSRRVMLRGEWWKTDSGNLLAFIEASETPVALVYNKRGYDLIDPHDPDRITRTRVDAKVAATLNWEAYVFYKPFPDHPIDGKGLLRRVAGESRRDLRFILTMAVVAGLLALLVPVATEHMLGKIIPSALTGQALTLFLGLVGLHVGIGSFNLARAFTLVRLEGKSNASLQGAVVDRMLALPVRFFRENPVGELAMRALSINAARSILTGAASVSVLAGISSLLYMVLLVYYNWRLALLSLLMLLVSAAVVITFARKSVRAQRENLAVQGKVSALVYQMISGIAKLRVAAAEGRLFSKWAERFKVQAELGHHARDYQKVIKVYNDLLPLLSSFVLFWLAGYLVRSGHRIDTATFVAFNAAYGALFASLVQLSDTVVHVMGIQPIIERARPILETVPEVEAKKPDPGALSGRIEGYHLMFRYKKDAPLVLDDVSFFAMPGEYIAFVGPSGSGKSTSLRMLLGFEEPDSGVIYYDGQDLKALDLSGVRSQIGVVLQNSKLISGSVFDNIVGSAPLAMDDAWAAAEMAGFADDIKDFPMGMHTVVAEGGANLSGGQQQRLLIARALVRKPRVLFFDEATSALDNRVQEQVSKSLERLNATRIVVAHRLSTIRNADRIYVMEKGKVVQEGGFDVLVKEKGLFADLMARQTV